MHPISLRSVLHTLIITASLITALGSPVTHVQAEPAPASYIAVAAGSEHTCALTTTGGVKCWGNNGDGKLGNGIQSDGSATPVDVLGLTSGVTAISAGLNHTCALTVTGAVKCWGNNPAGEWTNGSGLTGGIVALSSGWASNCVLTSSGAVKCWGLNEDGQLGNGTISSSSTPVDVIGLSSGVVAISVGTKHACAMMDTGEAKCWGNNDYGALGDGTRLGSNTPVNVVGLPGDVTEITAGASHTCALTANGRVYCWGSNGEGELGNGTVTPGSNVPVEVQGLDGGASAITTREHHVCAIMTGGGAKCWGSNPYGQLGNGMLVSSNLPVDVAGLTGGVTGISAGGDHTCALIDGNIMCWGRNIDGQAGNGILGSHRTVPVDVMESASAISASANASHTCVINSAGGVTCWGSNSYGKLGDGTTQDQNVPVNVMDLSAGTRVVSTSSEHTCAVVNDGVKCWGNNDSGQLGDGTLVNRPLPVDVAGSFTGLTSVSTGGVHTCVLADGIVQCWGANYFGQLGNGTLKNSQTPVAVTGLPRSAIQLSLGYHHACALLVDGSVWCWGHNGSGQLGIEGNFNSYSSAPVNVIGMTGHIVSISSGENHTCALSDAGGLKCWGYNESGQLGVDSAYTYASSVPVEVTGLASGVTSVAAGSSHTCATTTNGVKCWGNNDYGQLGDGTTIDTYLPVEVAGLTEDVSALSLGWGTTCALTTGGTVKCWGKNANGEVGDGTAWYTTPVAVVSVPASPHSVISIVRSDPTPTYLDSVDFIVTFSTPVTGVDTSAPFADFSLVTEGVRNAAITAVEGSGSQYTVSVSTGTGAGTLRLDVVDDDSILNSDSVPLGGAGLGNGDFRTGERYEVRTVMLDDELDRRFGAPNGYVQVGGSYPQTVMQADGRILLMVYPDAATEMHLIRLLEDGTRDSGFGTNGQITLPRDSVTSFALGPNGSIVVAGVCIAENFEIRLQRFLSNGQPDPTFNNGNPLCRTIQAGYYDLSISRVLVQPDGKIVILAHSWWCGGGISYPTLQAAGNAGMWCEVPSYLIRFDSHGSIDSTFGSSGVFHIYVPDAPSVSTIYDIYDVLVQKDGSFLMMATIRDNHAQEPYLAVIRVTSQGSFDTSFDGDGAFVYFEPGANRYGCALAVQQNGRILAMGSDGSSFLLGITAEGALDTSFGTAGRVDLPEPSCILLSLPTNAIVTAGFAHEELAVRMFDPDGSPNPFFANGWKAASASLGSPNALNLQPNGKIVLTSSAGSPTFVARLKLLFEDVSYLHWAQPWIERLYASGFTSGCAANPLRYCPASSITRAQMAIFLLRAKHGPNYTPPPATGMFTDVPADSPAAPWIEQLAREGVTGGCGVTPKQYCPAATVTRAQMAIFLLRAEHGSPYKPPDATGMFLDVPKTDFAAPFIEQLANEQITGGCGGGKFCPANPVTRDQMAVFLVRTFKLP